MSRSIRKPTSRLCSGTSISLAPPVGVRLRTAGSPGRPRRSPPMPGVAAVRGSRCRDRASRGRRSRRAAIAPGCGSAPVAAVRLGTPTAGYSTRVASVRSGFSAAVPFFWVDRLLSTSVTDNRPTRVLPVRRRRSVDGRATGAGAVVRLLWPTAPLQALSPVAATTRRRAHDERPPRPRRPAFSRRPRGGSAIRRRTCSRSVAEAGTAAATAVCNRVMPA